MGMPSLFRSLKREIDTLPLWMILLICENCFKLEDFVLPNNLKDPKSSSKRDRDLRKQIGIILDFEAFCTTLSRMLIGLYIKSI